MVVRLLHSARINHEAGEIVEVSPAQANFLLAVGSAERVEPIKKVDRETVDAETADVTPVKRTVRKRAK